MAYANELEIGFGSCMGTHVMEGLATAIINYMKKTGLSPDEFRSPWHQAHQKLELAISLVREHQRKDGSIPRLWFKSDPMPRNLKADHLSELWIHTNNSCNLQCAHCLVSSAPWEDRGMPKEEIKRIIDQGRELGVFRFYFTGGEPFIRKDIYELIDYVTRDENSELIVLTNGMFFNQKEKLNQLLELARGRFKPQISLDGSTPEINDPIRGKGTFEKIIEGIKIAAESGLNPTVTTVVTAANAEDIPNITRKNSGQKNLRDLISAMPAGKAYAFIQTERFTRLPRLQILTV
ncbi:MAG: hypothetical protein C4291_02835 [Candidatus Dadabacteria bacterium]